MDGAEDERPVRAAGHLRPGAGHAVVWAWWAAFCFWALGLVDGRCTTPARSRWAPASRPC